MKTIENHVLKFRADHWTALHSLYKGEKTVTGLSIWRKLRPIEKQAHDAATAQCNGETYNGQPWRTEDGWEIFKGYITNRVRLAFGGVLPEGFFINGDARGYALKLDPDSCVIPAGMHKDWGGNGILAAEIN